MTPMFAPALADSFENEPRRLPVASPSFNGNEVTYVLEALSDNWISSGRFVSRFESEFGARFGAPTIATSSGTAALHLTLAALGIGPGDEVLVPALTFIATANAVTYCGARPVIVDVGPLSWSMDIDAAVAARTKRTRAVIPVDLYGYPANIAAIRLALPGLVIIEDACEALGAVRVGKPAGLLADVACFSFYANKHITTGEGGAIVTRNGDLASRIRLLAANGQRMRRYSHEVVGYNYRLTDLQAAIGCAQLERWNWLVDHRRVVAGWYRARLDRRVRRQIDPPEGEHGHWAMAVLLPQGTAPDDVAASLHHQGIETRPFFEPLHQSPVYRANAAHPCPVAESLAARGIVLPLYSDMTLPDVLRVCRAVEDLIR